MIKGSSGNKKKLVNDKDAYYIEQEDEDGNVYLVEAKKEDLEYGDEDEMDEEEFL